MKNNRFITPSCIFSCFCNFRLWEQQNWMKKPLSLSASKLSAVLPRLHLKCDNEFNTAFRLCRCKPHQPLSQIIHLWRPYYSKSLIWKISSRISFCQREIVELTKRPNHHFIIFSTSRKWNGKMHCLKSMKLMTAVILSATRLLWCVSVASQRLDRKDDKLKLEAWPILAFTQLRRQIANYVGLT